MISEGVCGPVSRARVSADWKRRRASFERVAWMRATLARRGRARCALWIRRQQCGDHLQRGVLPRSDVNGQPVPGRVRSSGGVGREQRQRHIGR